mgnify:FL=1
MGSEMCIRDRAGVGAFAWLDGGLPLRETLDKGLTKLAEVTGLPLAGGSGSDKAFGELTEVDATLRTTANGEPQAPSASSGRAAPEASNATQTSVPVARLKALVEHIKQKLALTTPEAESEAGSPNVDVAALEARALNAPAAADRDNASMGLPNSLPDQPVSANDGEDAARVFQGAPRLAAGFSTERDQIRVHFPLDQDSLTPEAEEILGALITRLGQAEVVHRIRIDGHCDDSGSDLYNQSLSERRAARVRAYLSRHGIDAREISLRGHGERVPLMTTGDEDARAINRRAEILVEWVRGDGQPPAQVAETGD